MFLDLRITNNIAVPQNNKKYVNIVVAPLVMTLGIIKTYDDLELEKIHWFWTVACHMCTKTFHFRTLNIHIFYIPTDGGRSLSLARSSSNY